MSCAFSNHQDLKFFLDLRFNQIASAISSFNFCVAVCDVGCVWVGARGAVVPDPRRLLLALRIGREKWTGRRHEPA